MGGQGSGRPPSVETIIARQEQKVPIMNDDIFLPNYSGVKSEALKTSSAVLTNYWTLSGSNIYYNDGNVGIGTTSPAFLLDISTATDSSTAGGTQIVVNSNSSNYLRTGVQGFVMNRSNGSTANLVLRTTNAASWGAGGGGIVFIPNNTEAVRITASGSVGIGTTSPAEMLDLSGSFKMYKGQAIYWTGTTQTINVASDGTMLIKANGKITLNDNTGTMTLSGGNVGIGTSNPGSPLEVNGTVQVGNSNQDYVIQFATQRGFIGYDSSALGSGAMVIQGGSGNKGINFNVNSGTFGSGTAMTILNNSNVGIGTTNPTYLLTVQGNARVAKLLAATGSPAGPGICFEANQGTGIYQNASGEMGFTLTGSPVMYLSGSVVHLANASTSNPTLLLSGGLFISGGALWYKGSSGTQTKIANA